MSHVRFGLWEWPLPGTNHSRQDAYGWRSFMHVSVLAARKPLLQLIEFLYRDTAVVEHRPL